MGFSEFGYVSKFNVFNKQEHQYGIQFEKDFKPFQDLELELAFGYLHGLTDETSNHTILWNIELEFN